MSLPGWLAFLSDIASQVIIHLLSLLVFVLSCSSCSSLSPALHNVLAPHQIAVLNAIAMGMRAEETDDRVKVAATRALCGALEFVAQSFEKPVRTRRKQIKGKGERRRQILIDVSHQKRAGEG